MSSEIPRRSGDASAVISGMDVRSKPPWGSDGSGMRLVIRLILLTLTSVLVAAISAILMVVTLVGSTMISNQNWWGLVFSTFALAVVGAIPSLVIAIFFTMRESRGARRRPWFSAFLAGACAGILLFASLLLGGGGNAAVLLAVLVFLLITAAYGVVGRALSVAPVRSQ